MAKKWQKITAGIRGATSYAVRVLLTGTIFLTLASPAPERAEAASGGPLDLQLGGAGATSWNIGNIKPGDSGIQPVQLHNAGTKAGFVTIWVSDIVSSEGLNPESETGDKAEPGELDKYLLFGVSSNRSTVTLNLPATINGLPKSESDPNSIEIMPLKVGETVSMNWTWGLPVHTGNDVQGDSVSFSINYLLRELPITDISGSVSATGAFTRNVAVAAADTTSTVFISKDTVGKTKQNQPLNELWFLKIAKIPASLPGNKATVGGQFDAGPHGATFNRPVRITLTYDPAGVPKGASEDSLVVATWNENTNSWVELSGSAVDKASRTVSAQVTHFSRYAILVPVPPPAPALVVPPPRPTPSSVGSPVPPIVDIGTPRPTLSMNIMGDQRRVEIEADGTLSQPLKLADPGGNFVIELLRGSKILGSDGKPITRIEVAKTEEAVALPADTVALSSIFKVTGYVNDTATSRIDFVPFARLTILYDPKRLPENSFTPFIANYTVEKSSWVQLEPPPDSLFEIGRAKALIYHASLFAALAKLAPAPPPLPAEFEASNLNISPKKVRQNEPVVISLTISNKGVVAGTYEVFLAVDGVIRAVKEIALAGLSSQTISFEVSNLAPGTHSVRVAGLSGEFQATETVTILPAEGTLGWLFVDLSLGVMMVTLLSALYFIVRRSQRLRQGRFNVDNIIDAIRRKNRE